MYYLFGLLYGILIKSRVDNYITIRQKERLTLFLPLAGRCPSHKWPAGSWTVLALLVILLLHLSHFFIPTL